MTPAHGAKRKVAPSTVELAHSTEWSDTYHCMLCDDYFDVDADSADQFELNKGHACDSPLHPRLNPD